MESYVLEMTLDRAALLFEWRFERRSGGGTRLTQRVALSGENAVAYLAQVQSVFTSSLAPGMCRIAAAIERAEAETRD